MKMRQKSMEIPRNVNDFLKNLFFRKGESHHFNKKQSGFCAFL